MSAEVSFTLTQREDKNGNVYLFGALDFLNAVIFIRPEPKAPNEPQRWRAILKAYKPKSPNNLDANDSKFWNEK